MICDHQQGFKNGVGEGMRRKGGGEEVAAMGLLVVAKRDLRTRMKDMASEGVIIYLFN